jgi:hypothetical protein
VQGCCGGRPKSEIKDAFAKSGLYPPSLEKVLAAAAAATASMPAQEEKSGQGKAGNAAQPSVADGAPTRLEQQVAAAQPAPRKGPKKRANVVAAAFITSGLYERLETQRLDQIAAVEAAKQERKEARAQKAAAKAKRKPSKGRKPANKRRKAAKESSSDDE